MTKTRSKQTTRQFHAIVFHAFTQPVMHVKIAELLSCHGNKARTIAYENFYREYRLKATDFGKQNQ